MCAGRGCRAPHGEGVPGWLPCPLRRVAIRRRGTRAGGYGGRGISHLALVRSPGPCRLRAGVELGVAIGLDLALERQLAPHRVIRAPGDDEVLGREAGDDATSVLGDHQLLLD